MRQYTEDQDEKHGGKHEEGEKEWRDTVEGAGRGRGPERLKESRKEGRRKENCSTGGITGENCQAQQKDGLQETP